MVQKMKFEVLYEEAGWPGVSIPDSMDVEFRQGRTTHRFYTALESLVSLLAQFEQRGRVEESIGTGDRILVDPDPPSPPVEGVAKIRVSPVTYYAEMDVIEDALEDLLFQAFAAFDRMTSGPPDERSELRTEGLENVDRYLATLDLEPVAFEHYERFGSESNRE